MTKRLVKDRAKYVRAIAKHPILEYSVKLTSADPKFLLLLFFILRTNGLTIGSTANVFMGE